MNKDKSPKDDTENINANSQKTENETDTGKRDR